MAGGEILSHHIFFPCAPPPSCTSPGRRILPWFRRGVHFNFLIAPCYDLDWTFKRSQAERTVSTCRRLILENNTKDAWSDTLDFKITSQKIEIMENNTPEEYSTTIFQNDTNTPLFPNSSIWPSPGTPHLPVISPLHSDSMNWQPLSPSLLKHLLRSKISKGKSIFSPTRMLFSSWSVFAMLFLRLCILSVISRNELPTCTITGDCFQVIKSCIPINKLYSF